MACRNIPKLSPTFDSRHSKVEPDIPLWESFVQITIGAAYRVVYNRKFVYFSTREKYLRSTIPNCNSACKNNNQPGTSFPLWNVSPDSANRASICSGCFQKPFMLFYWDAYKWVRKSIALLHHRSFTEPRSSWPGMHTDYLYRVYNGLCASGWTFLIIGITPTAPD